ncbi:hypothetical protein D3C85_1307860 [compost metagenome]
MSGWKRVFAIAIWPFPAHTLFYKVSRNTHNSCRSYIQHGSIEQVMFTFYAREIKRINRSGRRKLEIIINMRSK